MKTNLIKSAMVLAGVSAVTGMARAQEESAWRRIGVSYRAAFNIHADFNGLGGYTSLNNPGAPGQITGDPGTIVRTYDDGFIGIDVSGNANGHTTYWGYNNGPDVANSQVVGDTVQMHSVSSPATASSDNVSSDPQSGIELSYFQPLGGGEKWSWGAEGAFNWTGIAIRDGRTLAGDVMTLTHAFNLDGVMPPLTPPVYVGPVDAPGVPQLSDNAVDVSGPAQMGAASINGYRKIEANLYGFRLGPYLEYAATSKLLLRLSGGFSCGLMDSKFSYSDTTTISGLGSANNSGSDSKTDWLYGGFVRGQASVNIYRSAWLFGGVEFNSLGTFEQSAGSVRAKLDLGSAVYVTCGLSVSF